MMLHIRPKIGDLPGGPAPQSPLGDHESVFSAVIFPTFDPLENIRELATVTRRPHATKPADTS